MSQHMAIVGPTASGKTDYALRLAAQQNAEIISVDSRQIYRHLSIGTSKPIGEWRESVYLVNNIPYHLVDLCEPTERFDAARFVEKASLLLRDIQVRGKKAIFVGGTGFYLKALTFGLAALPEKNDALRERLRAESETKGRTFLHDRLKQVDPTAAQAIPANNIHRLIRALEVHELTGKPISQWHAEHQAAQPNPLLEIEYTGLEWERATLFKRIEQRTHTMLKLGWVDETRELLKKGYEPTCPALTSLGYSRIVEHLQGQLSYDEMVNLLIQETRQYAKRQTTWFRHQLPVKWINLGASA